MTPLAFTTNQSWQFDSEAFALATLSLVAGQMFQIELTRQGTDGDDSLVGDWILEHICVEFS
jgi:hypothetical protein